MDIKELVNRKGQLEKEILEAIQKFVDETGLAIDSVDIQHFREQGGKSLGFSVKTYVKFP